MFIIHISYKKLLIFFIGCIVFIGIVGNFSLLRYQRVSKGRETSASVEEPCIRLPIVMYHHFLKSSKEWGKYIISPADFEKDLIYLEKKGYSTIDVTDLIGYVYYDLPLPSKPIMLTFDDGYLSYITDILPILKKYEEKAVVSIIGDMTDLFTKSPDDNVTYTHLNWEEVKSLVDSPNLEIQSHSYGLHNTSNRKGCERHRGESLENYEKALIKDIETMQDLIKEKTGYRPQAFTYPFGEYTKDSKDILKKMGFLAAFTCYEKVNVLPKDKEALMESLYELKRFNRPYGIDRAKFFGQFDK